MDILNRKLLTFLSTTVLFVLLLATGTFISIAANKTTQKQKVMAAAVFKFIKFVDWENNILQSKNSFHMCLQKYDASFEPFIKRKVQGKMIKLIILTAEKKPDRCDALYLNSTHPQAMENFNSYKNTATLTISEQAGFLSQGGIIELGSHNNRLTFSINQLMAKTNQLNIGFQLLSLAKHVI